MPFLIRYCTFGVSTVIILLLLIVFPEHQYPSVFFSFSSSSSSSVVPVVDTPNYPTSVGEDDCGKNYLEALGIVNHRPYCTDILTSLRDGFRNSLHGPFYFYDTQRQQECGIRWYSPSEVCDILQQSNRLLVFIGDSLLRHLHQSLYVLLSGNYRTGGMMMDRMKQEDPDYVTQCICQTQYNDHYLESGCRKYSMAMYEGLQSKYCPSWETKDTTVSFIVPHLGWYNAQIFNDHEQDFINTVLYRMQYETNRRGIIFLNTGLHNNLDADYVFPLVHQRIFTFLQELQLDDPVNGVQVVCVTVNVPQLNQLEEYRRDQGPAANTRYNNRVRKLCDSYRNGKVLDISRITNYTNSIDGVHSAMDINLVITQTILNYMVEFDKLTV